MNNQTSINIAKINDDIDQQQKKEVKLNHTTVDCYVLQISPSSQEKEIENKLHQLERILSQENCNIANINFVLLPLYSIHKANGEEIKQIAKFKQIIIFACDCIVQLGFNLIGYTVSSNKLKHNNPPSEIQKLLSELCKVCLNLSMQKDDACIHQLINHYPLDEQIIEPLYISSPVRSGSKIEHKGDIIVTNSVSNGAEIIAGGNIFIYGDARGKIIAGANPRIKNPRIFITKFNVEMVAISNIYKMMDNQQLINQLIGNSVEIFLKDNKINFVVIE